MACLRYGCMTSCIYFSPAHSYPCTKNLCQTNHSIDEFQFPKLPSMHARYIPGTQSPLSPPSLLSRSPPPVHFLVLPIWAHPLPRIRAHKLCVLPGRRLEVVRIHIDVGLRTERRRERGERWERRRRLGEECGGGGRERDEWCEWVHKDGRASILLWQMSAAAFIKGQKAGLEEEVVLRFLRSSQAARCRAYLGRGLWNHGRYALRVEGQREEARGSACRGGRQGSLRAYGIS